MNDDLYQELILDHGRHPRKTGVIPDATYVEKGFNPLCGDEITLYLEVKDEVITKVRFEGEGCAISQASSSLMAERIEGMPVNEALALFNQVHEMLMGVNEHQLGKLSSLSGVKRYPVRVKCATLAWHTLDAALKGSGPVSTEGDDV